MKRAAVAGIVGLVLLAPTAAAAAPPNLLDRTFGDNGTTVVRPVSAGHLVQCCFTTIDSTGRVLLTGNDVSSGPSRVFVQRLLPDGTPDPSYGRVVLPAVKGAASLVLTRPALLPDGDLEILTQARASLDSPSRTVLTRLLPSGQPDDRFGVGGRTVSPAVYSSSFISQWAVAPDGVTSLAVADPAGHWTLLRYNADGTLRQGRTALVIPGVNEVVWSIAVDSRRRTVVLGSTSPAACTSSAPAVLRVLADGGSDPAFGSKGVQAYPTAIPDDLFSLVPLPNGGYLLGDGISYRQSGSRGQLARIDDAGRLDSSFGTGGYVTVGNDLVFGTTVVGQTIVAAVDSQPGVVYRLDLATGAVDRTFGRAGQIPLTLPVGGMDSPGSVAVDGKGRILVAAGVSPSTDGYDRRGLVRRWLPAAGSAGAPTGATTGAPSTPARSGPGSLDGVRTATTGARC